jgi:ribosomal protein L14
MQVAGDKAAAILGVSGGVGSAKAGAETISIIRVGVEVKKEVSAKVGIEVGAEVRIATAGEIRKAGSVVRGFKGFEVKVGFSGKS